MHAPRGFGRNYFSLAAIQAYASECRLLQIITKIAWICPVCPVYTLAALSPPDKD